MNKIIFILIGLYSSGFYFLCDGQGNYNKKDSLLLELGKVVDDTTKVNISIALAQEYQYTNFDTAIIFCTQALKLAEQQQWKKGMADSYHRLGSINVTKGDYKLALEYTNKAIALWEEIKDMRGKAKSLSNIAVIYYYQGDYPNAMSYNLTTLKLQEEFGNKKAISKLLGNIALIYLSQSDYTKALDYLLKALKIDEELGDKNGIATELSNIGILYKRQSDYNKALDYYFKALAILEESEDKYGIAGRLNDIGNCYYHQRDFIKASDYYIQALKLNEELGNKNWKAVNLTGLGNIYDAQGDYSKALEYHFMSLHIKEELGDLDGIENSLGNIGAIYIMTGNYKKAEEFLKKAIEIDNKIGALDDLITDEKNLSRLYDTTGQYKLALEHFKIASVIQDSLFNQEKTEELTRTAMNFEFARREELSKIEQDKKDAIAYQQIQKQKVLKFSFIGGFATLALLSGIVLNNFRVRNKLKLQTLRNKIASDLHDDVGSTLSSISIFSEIAQQQSSEVTPMLEQIGENSRKMLEAMGDIVWTIHPENDQFEKIIERMRSFAFELLGARKINFVFEADENVGKMKLPMDVRKNLYLIFKEATNNMVKYSQADKASFSLSGEHNNLTMIIRDNGIGFDINHESQGNGIRNMKRRAEEIKGKLLIESEMGNGTTIQLLLRVA